MKILGRKIFVLPIFLITLIFLGSFLELGDAFDSFIYPEYSKQISMDFKDANLKDVLKIFSQQSGMNFIANSSIEDKTLTIYLEKVPVEKALESILTANNLTYEMKKGGNIFVVKEIDRPKIETITKIFYLKYATTTNSRLTKQISEGFSAEGSSDSDDAEGSSGIKEAVEEVLTENGRVVENSRTNSLLVTDIASQFPLIESTISKLDISIPQVLIEVEMLDVSKNLIDKIGFKIGEQPISYSGPTHTSYWPFENSEAVAKSGTPTTYTVGTLDLSRFTGLINILKSDAKTRYLARPRLLTLSNETAEIKITTDEAIGLKTTTQASEGTASQTSEAERATTGVSLKVTPQVNYVTGEITMFIEPTVSEARQGGTFGGTTFKDPEERGTKSVVRIKNSQTVVIGGLLRKQLNQTVTKVPFLGDVPIMGVLFRHNDKSQDEDRELIIFITPRIINERSIAANNNNTMISTYNLEREQDKPVKRYREINSELDKIDLIKNFRR